MHFILKKALNFTNYNARKSNGPERAKVQKTGWIYSLSIQISLENHK